MSGLLQEELLYLLRFVDYFIEQMIYEVLNDSEEDPQYSAVSTNNLIKCYIDVMHSIGREMDCSTKEDYLMQRCFTREEIEYFEVKREKEASYYEGIQY